MIQHAEYDPVKRKEYYERTKQLKGRRRSSETYAPAARRTSFNRTVAAVKPVSSNARSKSPTQTLNELEGRLKRLREVLQELVKQAKARSGVETKGSTSKSSSSTKAASSKPKTAAQKKEAAKNAKEYREKNETPSQKAAQLRKQIADVQKKIAKAREELAKAEQRSKQRSKKSSSAGAQSFKRKQ